MTMGFGTTFCNVLIAITSRAASKVLINGSRSQLFSIAQSVSQGCLLLSLLFIFVMEVFTQILNLDLG